MFNDNDSNNCFIDETKNCSKSNDFTKSCNNYSNNSNTNRNNI